MHVPLTLPRRKKKNNKRQTAKRETDLSTDGGFGRRTVARAKLNGLVRERDAREERGQLIPKGDVDISLVREKTLAWPVGGSPGSHSISRSAQKIALRGIRGRFGGPNCCNRRRRGGEKRGREDNNQRLPPPPSKAHSSRRYSL